MQTLSLENFGSLGAQAVDINLQTASDEELKETIKKKLEEAIREGGEQAESVSRTKLFARLSSAEWKEAA